MESEREIERKRALRVNGPSTTGETTTGIRPWTTNSLINQIPVCRTNGRANIEQPVSGTPRGIKVQGISEKRFFFGGAASLLPSSSPAPRVSPEQFSTGRGGRGALTGNLHATARRSQELFVDNQSVPSVSRSWADIVASESKYARGCARIYRAARWRRR